MIQKNLVKKLLRWGKQQISYLPAAKFGTSNYMKPFCSEWKGFMENQIWKTQKTVKQRRKISTAKSAKRQVFDRPETESNRIWTSRIQKLQSRQDGLPLYNSETSRPPKPDSLSSSQETDAHGQKSQERLSWCRKRRKFGADHWNPFVFTGADSSYAATVAFGSAEVRAKGKIPAARYHPQTMIDRFTFGVTSHTMGRCASSKHPKMKLH